MASLLKNNSQLKFYETRNHLWRPNPLDLNHGTAQNFNQRGNDPLHAYSTTVKSFYLKLPEGDSSNQLGGLGEINSTQQYFTDQSVSQETAGGGGLLAPKIIHTKRDIHKAFFEKNEYQHWSRILRARPRIDSDGSDLPGLLMKQSVRNKKTIQLDEERNTEIERENRILLEKITRILKSKQHGPKDAAIHFEGGRSKSQMYSNKHNSYMSIKRVKESQRLSEENQKILDRLMSQRSQFSKSQIKQDNLRHQQLLNNLSHFPKSINNATFSSRRLSPSPKIVVKHPPSKLDQHVHTKRGSLSPLKNEESMASKEESQLYNTDIIRDHMPQFDTKSSRQTLQLGSIGEMHPYESMEKSDYDNLNLYIHLHLKDSKTTQDNIAGRFLLQLPETRQQQRHRLQKRLQPTKQIVPSGIQDDVPILSNKSEVIVEGGRQKDPQKKRTQILISDNDYMQEYTNSQDVTDLSRKPKGSVQAVLNRQDISFQIQKQPYESSRHRSTSPKHHKDLKQAIKEYIVKNANNRYQSRIKSHKGRQFTPLKIWGLHDSNSSFASATTNNPSIQVGGRESLDQREVVYQKSRSIEGIMMTVEVSHTKNKVYITCIEQESMRQHIIQMFRKQAEFLIEQTDIRKLQSKKLQGFAKLTKLLEFRFGRLIINENKEIRVKSVQQQVKE